MSKSDDLISRQDAIDAWDKLSKRGRTEFDQVLMTLPSAEPEQYGRVFNGIVVEYPSINTYPEYEGKPYFQIKYTENGQEFIGYGTYKPEVLSEFLKEYFMPSAEPKTDEESELRFYYVESIDDYWIGQRLDNFYYADWREGLGFVWSKSRYLPWGEHIVNENTLWKEHTYPSEPIEIPFTEWIVGFVKKYFAEPKTGRDCTDFVRWLMDEVMDEENWQMNAVANGEIICRKLKKLGLLDVVDGYYVETQKAGAWIPVSEKPKDEKRTYLVQLDSGGMRSCRWTNANPIWTELTVDWHWNTFDIPQYCKVVAWMDLEPYREDGEEE